MGDCVATVGCVGAVGTVTVGTVTGDSVVSISSSFTCSRFLSVLPITSLSSASASVSVSSRIAEILTVGTGGGTVGQVTSVVGGALVVVVGGAEVVDDVVTGIVPVVEGVVGSVGK